MYLVQPFRTALNVWVPDVRLSPLMMSQDEYVIKGDIKIIVITLDYKNVNTDFRLWLQAMRINDIGSRDP